MMWLIVIVQLGRAAPRQRRRVSGELAAAGAVSISEGVWAVPDTPFHRTAVDGCTRRAVDAGGDIVILNTSPENSPTHDVLEAALTESLTAEAADLARRWEALTGAHFADTAEDPDDAERQKDINQFRLEAARLSRKDVMGLESVNSVLDRITRAAVLPANPASAPTQREQPNDALTVHYPDLTAPAAQHRTEGPVLCSPQ